ncbi:hypothetical protein [Streptomyces sp. TP-A0356]|uniref:hypothetical protein n=1 Tax=Streptomyces sp. TP-A0356 TaxID=1359208 RepID=UPI0006E3D42C|nr:hypothetical protein [Streptomyces sp. TP-A0356]
MSARSRAVRERQTRIGRIARQMNRDHGRVRPDDVTWIAISAGMKTSPDKVRTVLARMGLHR